MLVTHFAQPYSTMDTNSSGNSIDYKTEDESCVLVLVKEHRKNNAHDSSKKIKHLKKTEAVDSSLKKKQNSAPFGRPQGSVQDCSLKIEETEWLTTEQAALYLKVSKKTLLNMVSSGRVPYSKLGRSNRYPIKGLRELLLSQCRGVIHGN